VGVCVVAIVIKHQVGVCKAKKPVDSGSWTWDLSVPLEFMTKEMFAKWLSYNSPSLKDKYWAVVHPEAHKWILDEI